MTTLKLPSFAKINLYLRVVGKRPDGYHEIETIFQTVSLCDFLTFEKVENSTEIRIETEDKRVPTDEKNIITRAGRILQAYFGTNCGANVRLEKNIPTMAGLGGGSSNAATALLAFSHLWNLRPTQSNLLDFAAKLGADVPFFLYGGTALGTGTGTTITRLDEVSEAYILLVAGNEFVKTENAYERLSVPRLTNSFSDNNLTISCDGKSIENLINIARNDFEEVIFKIKPSLKNVKETLLESQARWTMMSGSGASVAAVFDSLEESSEARRICRNNGWQSFEAETVSRTEYLNQLLPVSYLIESFSDG